MPDTPSGTFGLAIAFVAPGIVGLWAIGLFVPTVQEWFGATASTPATGGGFLFVIVASLAVGLLISGIRQEVLDEIVFTRLGTRWSRLQLSRPPVDASKLTNPEVRAAVQFSAEYLYRYYQFYSNMAVAIVLSYVAWLIHTWHWSPWRLAGFLAWVAAVAVLYLSARYSLRRYYDSLTGIFGPHGGNSHE